MWKIQYNAMLKFVRVLDNPRLRRTIRKQLYFIFGCKNCVSWNNGITSLLHTSVMEYVLATTWILVRDLRSSQKQLYSVLLGRDTRLKLALTRLVKRAKRVNKTASANRFPLRQSTLLERGKIGWINNKKSIEPVTNIVQCSLLKGCHNAQFSIRCGFIIRSRMIKGGGKR